MQGEHGNTRFSQNTHTDSSLKPPAKHHLSARASPSSGGSEAESPALTAGLVPAQRSQARRIFPGPANRNDLKVQCLSMTRTLSADLST